jgi:hypothetical protein
MQDMHARLEKLRSEASECARVRDLAIDPEKKQLFIRLAAHLNILADEVEQAIASNLGKPIA